MRTDRWQRRLAGVATIALAVMLAGCGLPGPTHKTGVPVALDDRPDCSVYGFGSATRGPGNVRAV